MYLAKVDPVPSDDATAAALAASSSKWRDWPASTLQHHGKACCDVAREWLLGIDRSQLAGAPVQTGPRWLRHRFRWGPSPWPLHWCEAVVRKRLDCGAHAAMAHAIFSARGVQSFPAQFVQRYSPDAIRHWADNWLADDVEPSWLDGELIYHEGCAVIAPGQRVKLWDASAGWWIDPERSDGYGSLLAVRVVAPEASVFHWGPRLLKGNAWEAVEPLSKEARA